ncbi:pentapeptide repeat-containing protein [Pseudanabaena sp. ABRG5-3]|uniref:pentapeptide repeat-containing protein n=1 Tax=Pseudanabaena sp. ABRG5-3 TaxID=685565 RepID=UPI000F845885|nr:pentapeptide repeat-containing protein [Pseudanabaena sp. ABRG5-3]
MTKATRSLIASEKGIERARKALIDLGINQTGLEKKLGISRSTISSFFNRTKPIDHPYFTEICKTLNLKWEEIVEKDNPMKPDNYQIENTLDVETNSPRLAAFVIEGSFPVDALTQAKIQALVKQLQKITGDASLEIVDIQEGSIKIILTGTPEALTMIQKLYESGLFTEVDGIPIVSVSFDSLMGTAPRETPVDKLDLRGANLSKITLSELDLRGADLRGADFRGVNLNGLDFRGADLRGANLSELDLKGANFRGANLIGAKFKGTRLIGSEFREAKLIGSNLSEANLSEANLSEAELIGANLSRSDLIGTNLREVNLIGANLIGVDLIGANLIGANLIGANLSLANLNRANLSLANFSKANLSRATLTSSNLSGATLTDTYVAKARFSDNLGISEVMKFDLIYRGAIFDDSLGDRSGVLTPAPV